MHEVALREGNDTSISNFSCDTVFSHFRIEKKKRTNGTLHQYRLRTLYPFN